jgi:gas vesicle protein GvpO
MAQSTRGKEDTEGADGRISAHDLTLVARRTVEELTGYPPEAVSGFQWDGETWLVSVDVCELTRVPNTTDVMATYIVQLDDRGGLLGYKRDRRYQRGHAEGG